MEFKKLSAVNFFDNKDAHGLFEVKIEGFKPFKAKLSATRFGPVDDEDDYEEFAKQYAAATGFDLGPNMINLRYLLNEKYQETKKAKSFKRLESMVLKKLNAMGYGLKLVEDKGFDIANKRSFDLPEFKKRWISVIDGVEEVYKRKYAGDSAGAGRTFVINKILRTIDNKK